jgi:hypothetical protein
MNFRNLAARGRALWLVGLIGLLALGAISFAGAQEQVQQAEKGITGTPGVVLAHSVVNFAELARKEKLHPPKHVSKKYVPFRRPPKHAGLPPGAVIKFSPASAPSVTGRPTVEPESGTTPVPQSPNPAAGFLALLDDQTVIPPDTQGTVGPTQLMVTLNSQVKVQTRAGGNQKTVSLDAFWNSVLGPPPSGFTGIATTDPRVVYDPYGGRWITSAAAYPASTGAGVLVGVSQTSNATGLFNLYKVAVDSTNQHFCDFPILGFNSQWVVVMCNVFANDPNVNFFAGKIYVFNKATLYAGGAAVPIVIDDANNSGIQGSDTNVTPASTYDPTLTTEYLVEEYFGNDTTFVPARGEMRLWQLTGPVNAPVLSTVSFPSTLLTWDESGSNNFFGPQLGAPGGIDTGFAQTTNVIYRNGHIWTAHTVFLPSGGSPTRSSAQWWELDINGNILQNGLIDTPDASAFRAYPSIGVNKFDDVLIGYSRFTPTGFASAYYSYRGHADPNSVLQNEALLKAGQASYFKTYGGPSNRWGDYSNTAVDPLDDTALWTIQEYADFPVTVNGQPQSTWGTWWGEVVPPFASLVITQNPATAVAGASFPFRVTAEDADQNVITSYTGTVQFTSSDPTATFLPSSSYTFVAGDAGTHLFSATLDRAGAQSVSVSDAAAGVQNSFTITVNPAPATKLQLAAPATATKGVAFNLAVTALDQFGNRATGYPGTIHFTSSDPAPVLPADYSFTSPGDSGRHVFSVTLGTVGAQTVTATDTLTSTITGTASITVANISGAMQRDLRVRLGTQFTNLAVATFTVANPPGTLTATIDWGDGRGPVPSAPISNPVGGVYTVFGNTQYARPPKNPITVTVTDTVNGTITLTGNVRFWPKTESH